MTQPHGDEKSEARERESKQYQQRANNELQKRQTQEEWDVGKMNLAEKTRGTHGEAEKEPRYEDMTAQDEGTEAKV